MLSGGVAMVTIFSDPMCDVLSGITDEKNAENGGSYINISPFYVSFVVTPICSNASELVSSLLFAAKKKKENVSMTFSQLYGAATMNNTLCLAIFCALVYFKDLEWYYSAEVTVILLVQWFVFAMGYTTTYKLWKLVPVGFLYIFSIILIAILESSAVGWK
ncbi:sodium/calcium exchanger NCL2-like [Dendronephthya gigantea]|uniref:sodium/calcium exchanger NCL2-like n=1 Tax=Dendronephthya gigantea TaxID=151771 RepID=UPI00106A709C|nr:sodium/calcium exchanger NCL2-like [Dendronephthya gigantea]XP_028417777.1 sodium/calcium exchanger NCL2-like [Dendronephthya gigantea]